MLQRKFHTSAGPVRPRDNSVSPQRVNGTGICSRSDVLGKGVWIIRFLPVAAAGGGQSPGLVFCFTGSQAQFGEMFMHFLLNVKIFLCDFTEYKTPVCWWTLILFTFSIFRRA